MDLDEFHDEFRAELHETIRDRISAGEGPFPSEELVFAEMVMERIAEAGLTEAAEICHWSGTIGNASLRITGHALSADETALDLFVTRYFGTETIAELANADVIKVANEGVRFLFRSAGGSLEARIDPTHPVRDLVATIRARWTELDRLRVIVLTDGRTKAKQFSHKEVQGKMVAIEAMDVERLFRHAAGKPREEIAISMRQAIGTVLPCVHVPNPDADYDYALTAIPAEVVRNLYLTHGQRLLEANVRTFLGMKKAVNRGIVETLKTEPGHFLAFNNGLVLVCDEARFERAEDGSVGLSFLKGLQIVNGGQTTSSIYFASRDDRTIDLGQVMVPAKIIILKGGEDDARDRLIASVSRFANSQNAVKTSDLSANRPFHVQLEKLANDIWCPDGVSRWFYERAAGAWNVMLLREPSAARRKKLKEAIPTRRKLTKNDVARYHESWRGLPHQVALAGEKNFAAFMRALDEDPGIVPNPLDPAWYRAMIAKVILFKAVESLIKTKEAKQTFRQGYVNIAAYSVAVVADRFGPRLDLEMIWQRQGISDPLRRLLWDWAVIVNETFARIAPGRQISEVAKAPATWNTVRAASFPAPQGAVPELPRAGTL